MKVKALTILELMVALVVMSVVVTGSYWGYQFIVSTQMSDARYQDYQIQKVEFITQLIRDVDDCDWIANRGEELDLISSNGRVTYLTCANGVIRKALRTDTLSGNFFIRTHWIEEGRYGLINRVDLIDRDENGTTWYVNKVYSSQTLWENGY
ncbi:MAG: prepilin-type N-terminal cleavage/methylation domain-containing protein [Flavobacteriales bacterium]|nr:prepilin-type N-terminal cleavage/methylation domain-containing protein [Flavobacteriales bacterium]